MMHACARTKRFPASSWLGAVISFLIVTSVCAVGVDAKPKSCRLKRSAYAAGASPGANQQHPFGPSPTPSPTPSTQGVAASPGTPSPTPALGDGALVIRSRFPYGNQTVRGVNLGGWFVLEPWINPGMFNATNNNAIVDEYTYGLYQDQSEAQGILENHWDTWITEDDFAAISAAGLNHVRIPMPYWSIPTPNTTTQPFITGSWPRLLRAVSWASKYDLSVIIDIHGAPGSQNGYDNSGQKMDYPQWHTSQANVDRTLQAFQALLGEFSQSKWGGTVGAIEALNEPAGIYQDVLNVTNQYWTEAYTRLQALRVSRGTERAGDVNPQEIKMVIMDGFIGIQNYRGFLTPPQSQGVMMDTHCYQLFNTEQIALTQAQHIPQACAVGQSLATGAAGGLWTYVGEWTSSPTDCTPWLNGRFAPSVWVTAVPGRSCTGMTGRWQNFTDDYKNFLAQYFEAQVEAYEMVQGWIYWTWKTETTDEWSYQKGMEGGWIPKNINDSTQRRFPNICKQP